MNEFNHYNTLLMVFTLLMDFKVARKEVVSFSVLIVRKAVLTFTVHLFEATFISLFDTTYINCVNLLRQQRTLQILP